MEVKVDNGKYTIRIDEQNGHHVSLLRYDEAWVDDPLYSKMLIAIAYELEELRDLVKERTEELAKVRSELTAQ